ncbi:MAG: replication-associated recombination protein A [Cytophagaceae bacterium]|nr:replication-associated recombination protein A [Cytophagaceae bacterium]MDW8457090.1 replication-associated recombination protein A [Cytophagaceae bacterium]
MTLVTKPPLSERMRPTSLESFLGQQHLVGKGKILWNAAQSGNVPSMILWGPPGTGKTTLAGIMAKSTGAEFISLSAIHSGVKEVREAIEKATSSPQTVVFIDEIHRFSKSQQDALLHAVEKGIIILIGATTENPSFEINKALLSRCQVYVLHPLKDDELLQLAEHAILHDEILKQKEIHIKEHGALLSLSGGDARKLLNLLELCIDTCTESPINITDELVFSVSQKRTVVYDKSGDMHYDIISAFIKSIRGSDPNAAVYWLARMIEGGEDVSFIARRLVILASEDIGNANPTALVMATSCFQAVNLIGYPEARIILAQTVTYLASSPKSNAAYLAINNAIDAVYKHGNLPVPLHLRNAPTSLMKNLHYGHDYKYAHDYENNFYPQEYMPDELKGTVFYNPQNNAREDELRQRLKKLWKQKYGY